MIVVTGGPGSGKSVIALSLLGSCSGRAARPSTRLDQRLSPRRCARLPGLAIPGQEPVRLLQPVRGCRAEFAGRAHPGRGPPDPGAAITASRRGRNVPRSRRSRSCSTWRESRCSCSTSIKRYDPGDRHRARHRPAAAARGLDVQLVELDAQFRSGGSRVYEDWVLRLLGLSDGGPMPWPGDELPVVARGHPRTVGSLLEDRFTEGYAAWPRASAGHGLMLSGENRFAARCADRAVGAAVEQQRGTQARGCPGRSLWATDDGGFGQIGCVYTAQGFEYDWSGDSRRRSGVARRRFVSDVRESKDPAFRGRTVPTSTCSCVTSTRCC